MKEEDVVKKALNTIRNFFVKKVQEIKKKK